MTILSILAQISGLDTAFSSILSQYGAIAFIIAIVGFMAFLTWRNSEDARTRRQLSEIERTKEDTKRDSLISDLASKTTLYADDIAKLRETVAEERGARNLLSEQLGNERKERLEERETLKNLIRDVSDKLKSHEARIEELTNELNGKKEEIKALRLERDLLNTQLKDKDVRVMALEKDIEALQLSKRQLEAKAEEQALQIASLARQLADMDKTIFDTPTKPMPPIMDIPQASNVTVSTAPSISEIDKELQQKEHEDKANETP